MSDHEPKKEIWSAQELREDLVDLFTNYAALIPDQLRKRQDPPVNIISVGCGAALELLAVGTIFNNPNYLGIDKHKNVLTLGKAINADILTPEEADEKLQLMDAADTNSFGRLLWDIVILRNPQVFGQFSQSKTITGNWKKVLTNSLEKTAPNGFLILTTTDRDEHESTMKFFDELGKADVLIRENDISDIVKSPYPIKERYISVLQKK